MANMFEGLPNLADRESHRRAGAASGAVRRSHSIARRRPCLPCTRTLPNAATSPAAACSQGAGRAGGVQRLHGRKHGRPGGVRRGGRGEHRRLRRRVPRLLEGPARGLHGPGQGPLLHPGPRRKHCGPQVSAWQCGVLLAAAAALVRCRAACGPPGVLDSACSPARPPACREYFDALCEGEGGGRVVTPSTPDVPGFNVTMEASQRRGGGAGAPAGRCVLQNVTGAIIGTAHASGVPATPAATSRRATPPPLSAMPPRASRGSR